MLIKPFTRIKNILSDFSLYYYVLWLLVVVLTQYNGMVTFALVSFLPLLIVNLNKIIASLARHLELAVVWLLLLIYYSYNSVFQATIPPFAYDKTIAACVYLCAFLLVTELFKEKKSRGILVTNLLLNVFTLLVTISSIIQFFVTNEVVQKIFSTMLPYFGHNHFPSILLVFFPLLIDKYLKNKNKRNGFMVVVWSLSFLLSAGRVVIVLGLAEVCFLIFLNRKHIGKRNLFLIITPLWVSIIIWFTFLNVKLPMCHQFENSNYCKPLTQETRISYWKQALKIIENKPIYGSGLGSFLNESQKYLQTARFKTGYAHNDILQILSETGLIGLVLMSALVVSFIFEIRGSLKNSKNRDSALLLIGVLFLIGNGFFDFDLSLSGTMLVFLTALANVIVKDGYKKYQNKYLPIILKQFSRLFLAIIIISISLYTAIQVSQKVLMSLGLANRAVEIFPPIFTFPSDKLEEIVTGLSQPNKQHLDIIYKNYLDYWLIRVHQDEFTYRQETRASIIETINALQPWTQVNFNNAKYYLSINKPEKSLQVSQQSLDFIRAKETESQYYFPKYYYWRISNDLITATKQFINRNEYKQAKQSILLALYINNNLLAEIDPLISEGKPQTVELDFFVALTESQPPNLGGNKEVYIRRIESVLTEAYQSHQFSSAIKAVKIVSKLESEKKDRLIIEYVQKVLANLDYICKKDSASSACNADVNAVLDTLRNNQQLIVSHFEYPQRLQLSKWLYSLLQRPNYLEAVRERIVVVSNEILPGDYWTSAQLGNYYISIGKLEKASQAFDTCLQQFNYVHDDCAGGKQLIHEGKPNKERFDQVSQIILTTKRWQDFQ